MFELKWVQMESTSIAKPILLYRHMQPCVDASGALCPGEWSAWKPVPIELVSYDNVEVTCPQGLGEKHE